LNYWLSTIVGFYTRLTILAKQILFNKDLVQSFANTAAEAKNKFV